MEKKVGLILSLICIVVYSFFTAISLMVLFGEITLSPKFMARVILIFSLDLGIMSVRDYAEIIESEKVIEK